MDGQGRDAVPQAIGQSELIAMLRGAVEQVRRNHEMLSKLDSFGGDGDHGTTMLRAMGIVEKVIETPNSGDPKSLLNDIGWGILGVDGGATGPLFGTFFMGMSEAATGQGPVDAGALASMFESGLAAVQKRTPARVGDKTMIDALVPAVQAMRSAADAGADLLTGLERAVEAAEQGAASTKDLQARFGRARNIGARSVGSPDPGAASVALIFRGFVEGVRSLA